MEGGLYMSNNNDFDVISEMMRQVLSSPYLKKKKFKRKSCKKRKIEYIREKNRFRYGKRRPIPCKVSMYGGVDKNMKEVFEMIENYFLELKTKYKLPIQKKQIEIGLTDNDFVENRQTILVKVGI